MEKSKFVGSEQFDFTRGPKLLGDPGVDSGGTRRDITRDQVRLALPPRWVFFQICLSETAALARACR